MTLEITGSFEIAKLELRAGDKLVVKTELLLSREQATNIRERFKQFVPDDVEVIILSSGLSIEVLRTEAELRLERTA